MNMGKFFSVGLVNPGTIPLFAEVVDFALPVDPLQTLKLIVEDDPETQWWMIHCTAGYMGPLVAFSAHKQAFVVPI